MTIHHPYPYRRVTPEELQELIRRARAERAQVIRNFFLALFRRKLAAGKELSLGVGACR